MNPNAKTASVEDLRPSSFLREHVHVFLEHPIPGPVLDLACGEGHNGLFLAAKGIPVVLLDRSEEALAVAQGLAEALDLDVECRAADLENTLPPPLPNDSFRGVIVFKYLHRPLFPYIRDAVKSGGLVVYETFTEEQRRFGRPRNPAHLLKPGELQSLFEGWDILHTFEGVLENPSRAMARIICTKP